MYHGLLLVNKPRGMVSKDVSRIIQKALKPSKIKLGHVGTLDPLADGALPVVLGEATKLQDYLLELPKEYIFEMSFGSMTTTMDLEGDLVETSDIPELDRDQISSYCRQMEGEVSQVPPIYSAVKFQGRPLYDYARNGEQDLVDLESLSRHVIIYSLNVLELHKDRLLMKVMCSKGTYVRVIAHDLAKKLGAVCTVTKLHRSIAASYDLKNSVSPEEITHQTELALSKVIPVEKLSIGIGTMTFDSEVERKLSNGLSVQYSCESLQKKMTFHEGVSINGQNGFKSLENSYFLMLNSDGRAFGVGMIRCLEYPDYLLKMKRGISYGKQ